LLCCRAILVEPRLLPRSPGGARAAGRRRGGQGAAHGLRGRRRHRHARRLEPEPRGRHAGDIGRPEPAAAAGAPPAPRAAAG
jgi:hypothetical protein